MRLEWNGMDGGMNGIYRMDTLHMRSNLSAFFVVWVRP